MMYRPRPRFWEGWARRDLAARELSKPGPRSWTENEYRALADELRMWPIEETRRAESQ